MKGKKFRELTLGEADMMHLFLEKHIDHRASLSVYDACELEIGPWLSDVQLGAINGIIAQWARIAEPSDEQVFSAMVKQGIGHVLKVFI